MFFRILKRDIKHKRGINVILFLFMLLATIFVASSVNNILVVTNATDYCMEKGNVSDRFISAYQTEGKQSMGDWLANNDLVTNFSENKAVMLSSSNFDDYTGKSDESFKSGGTIMLQSQWKENMLIYDEKGNLVEMKDGEIGMQEKVMRDNGLKIGDTIRFKLKDTYMTFQITKAIMDPAMGGDFTGISRFVISDHDFAKVCDTGMSINYDYCIDSSDATALTKEINKQNFNILVTIDRDMFEYAYVMPLITAMILIVFGIGLILIAFLILRFIILFTISEEYKEIGIMKAIGIKNGMIRSIYLVKYFVLVSVAAVIGCFLSVPVSNAMINSVKTSMMMENAKANFVVNVLCALFVAVVVLLICYLCTNRLRKFSAIEAIRCGESGERFHKKSKLALHRCKHFTTAFFMAANDILSNIKRYIVLILTFTFGLLIIILPLNTLSTFDSTEMAKNFMFDPDADFYMSTNIKDENNNDTATTLTKAFDLAKADKVKDKFREKGYDISIEVSSFYTFSYYADDKDSMIQLMTMVPLTQNCYDPEIIDGYAPIYENEIAVSEKALKKINAHVGDTIHVVINGEDKEVIVSGSYQNYMQTGLSAYFNQKINVDRVTSSGCWMFQCRLNGQNFNKNVLNQMRTDLPQYKIYNIQEAMNTQLGSTGDQMKSLKYSVIILVCIINVLITVLMMKIFIIGENSQIALLRSVGFSVRVVRIWQMLRFGIVMIISAIIGTILSIPLNNLVLKKIFGFMGATHIKIIPNPWEVYLIYPLLLMAVICFTAYLSSGSIKKLKLIDINNQE